MADVILIINLVKAFPLSICFFKPSITFCGYFTGKSNGIGSGTVYKKTVLGMKLLLFSLDG